MTNKIAAVSIGQTVQTPNEKDNIIWYGNGTWSQSLIVNDFVFTISIPNLDGPELTHCHVIVYDIYNGSNVWTYHDIPRANGTSCHLTVGMTRQGTSSTDVEYWLIVSANDTLYGFEF